VQEHVDLFLPIFTVQVSGNNPTPSSFALSDGGSQSVTLGAGQFNIVETPTSGFTTSFSGDCMQSTSNSQQATGTIAVGQQKTCTITNTEVPTTGTLLVSVVCADPLCTTSPFHVQIVPMNNPQPLVFDGRGSGSQTFTLTSGNFEVDMQSLFPGVFSGNCLQVFTLPQATGTISAGQHLTCTFTERR